MAKVLISNLHRSHEIAITASVTQTQGQGALTEEENEIDTVANQDDTVTLKSVRLGARQRISNHGANALQIFPASGQNLGEGVDQPFQLAKNNEITFIGLNSTTWDSHLSAPGGEIVTLKGSYQGDTNTPDLETAPNSIKRGDLYVVNSAGSFLGVNIDTGDIIMARSDSPSIANSWAFFQEKLQNSDIATAYNSQVTQVVQSEAEAGTSGIRRGWTAQRVAQAIKAIAVPDIFARKMKTADETIDSNATVQNDDDIFFEANANKIYFWELRFFVNSVGVADFKSAWTIPAGATMDRANNHTGAAPTAFTDATVLKVDSTSGTPQVHTHIGRLKTGGTAGTVQWQWAQNIVNGNDTTVGFGTQLVVYEQK